MPGRERLVVIGNGMAGARAVEEILRRNGRDRFGITVFGDEPYGNYNRILLSGVLGGSYHADGIFLNPLDWYRENGIDLRAGVRANRIDPGRRAVTTAEGEVVTYDTLVLATGSRPFIPPVEGLIMPGGRDKPGVFAFRTIDDCQRIAAYAGRCRTAAVVGGGLLGLEAARGLLSHGLRVQVAHIGSHLMDRQLDPAAGTMLKAAMERMGVEVQLGVRTSSVLGDDQVEGLAFSDDTWIECDLVVFACGIRPNVEIARACGLTVDRGIVVDDRMRSIVDSRIYAVGECAQHDGVVYGLVAPLWEQARVLADHVTGADLDAAYRGSRVTTRLKVMGIELASMGVTEPQGERDEVVQFSDVRRGIYKKMILREGKLVGGIFLGDLRNVPYLARTFESGMQMPDERGALFFDLTSSGRPASVAEMPGDTPVCHCNGVDKESIRRCVAEGRTSADAVMMATRAGTGCGTCRGVLQQVVDWARSAERIGMGAGAGAADEPGRTAPLGLELAGVNGSA